MLFAFRFMGKSWATQMKSIVASILVLIASTSEAFEHAGGVVGLFHLPCAEESVRHIDIFASPDDGQPIGQIYYAEQKRGVDDEPICDKATVYIEGGRTGELPLIFLKYDAGAVVLTYKKSWLEIKLDKGSAWVRDPDGQRNISVEALLMGDMSYVRVAAPVPVQTAPGRYSGNKPLIVGDRSQLDVEVLKFRRVNGKLWVKIKSTLNPCYTGERSIKEYKRQKHFSGWLPFHDTNGQPTVWFYSGGC